MNRIDQLIENYRSHIQMPVASWTCRASTCLVCRVPGRRGERLINRIDEFEMLTKECRASLGPDRPERQTGRVDCLRR